MSEGRSPKPLDDLDARLARARAEERKPAPDGGLANPTTGFGLAFRIGIELVAALVVGVGIGLLLDRWLGTGPWFMIAFFFVGAAAGVLNVYRAASGIGLAPGYGKPADDGPRAGKDGDDAGA